MNIENPYQSPDDTSSPTSGLAQDATERTLTWLLFSFCGRIPRRAFWTAIVIATLVHSAAAALVGSVLPEESLVSIIAVFLLLLTYVVYSWIYLALQVKRWHDRGRSGWWFFISFLPLIGPLITFVEIGCLRGTVGQNRFGADPTGDSLSGASLLKLRNGQMCDARVIELDGTSVVDEHLTSLVGNAEIEELRLGGTAVTDSGLGYLRSLTTLRQLDLSLTAITDAGLEALLELPRLDTLWLGGTEVSDAGLIRLAAIATLEDIHAINTSVTAQGVHEFKRLRPDCNVHI